MRAALDAFVFVVILIAGWVNRHQQHTIEYLNVERPSLPSQLIIAMTS